MLLALLALAGAVTARVTEHTPLNRVPFIMTHDAASGYLGGGLVNDWTKTQRGGLVEQLGCGARAFDARPALDPTTGELVWHHGDVTVERSFAESLADVVGWCRAHPEELVILSIWDCAGDGCAAAVADALDAARIPTVAECATLANLTLGGARALAELPGGGGRLLAITGSGETDGVACSVGNYDPANACSGFGGSADAPPAAAVACADGAGVAWRAANLTAAQSRASLGAERLRARARPSPISPPSCARSRTCYADDSTSTPSLACSRRSTPSPPRDRRATGASGRCRRFGRRRPRAWCSARCIEARSCSTSSGRGSTRGWPPPSTRASGRASACSRSTMCATTGPKYRRPCGGRVRLAESAGLWRGAELGGGVDGGTHPTHAKRGPCVITRAYVRFGKSPRGGRDEPNRAGLDAGRTARAARVFRLAISSSVPPKTVSGNLKSTIVSHTPYAPKCWPKAAAKHFQSRVEEDRPPSRDTPPAL